jgi:hypothetical protein
LDPVSSKRRCECLFLTLPKCEAKLDVLLSWWFYDPEAVGFISHARDEGADDRRRPEIGAVKFF